VNIKWDLNSIFFANHCWLVNDVLVSHFLTNTKIETSLDEYSLQDRLKTISISYILLKSASVFGKMLWDWLLDDKSIREHHIVFPIIIPLTLPLFALVVFYIIILNIGEGEWMLEHFACDHSGINFYLKHCGFRYDVIWLVLVSYVTLATLLVYKGRFVKNLKKLRDNGIIAQPIYYKCRRSLVNRRIFVILLGIFEILYFISFWSPCKPTVLPCPQGFPTGVVSYLAISIAALPIGTASVTALSSSILAARYVSLQSNIKVFDPDKRGGLSPIIELLFYATSIFSGGLLISAFLFPELYSTERIVYGSIFIVFDFLLFFAPQIYIQRVLASKKKEFLDDAYKNLIYWLDKLINISDPERSAEDAESYNQNLSPYQSTREEINQMITWPLDINSLKFTLQLVLTIISIIFIKEPIVQGLQGLLK
jgi:hypothetical protein